MGLGVEPPARTPSTADTQPRQRTVVVIDDDPGVLNLILQILGPAGYRVVCCGDSTKAIDLVRREQPDLVLCDIVMPGLDGYAVHQALQTDPATAGAAFIFLSGHGGFTERVRAFRAGVVDFMTKPFTHGILLRKVEKLLERKGGAAAEPAAPVVVRPAEGSGARRGVRFDDVPEEFRRVLIVDDEAEYRRWIRQLLEPHGFVVLESEDGAGALRCALEERPWLVLTDVAMPRMNGFELCRRFRAHPVLKSMSFVILSGLDDYKERRQGIEAGADDFLPKTLSVRELLMRVRLALQAVVDAMGWTRRGPGMAGDMEVIGPSGALQMCHQSRLTGIFDAHHADNTIEVRLREGEVVGARCGALAGAAAVLEFLSWPAGRFEFRHADPGLGEPLAQSISELVLEGCRRLDESRR